MKKIFRQMIVILSAFFAYLTAFPTAVFADIVAVPTPAQEGSDVSMIGIAFLVICIAAASVFILKKILGK